MTTLTRSQHRVLDLCVRDGGYKPSGSAGSTIQVLVLMDLVAKDSTNTYVATKKGRQIRPRIDHERLRENAILDYLRDKAQGETATDIAMQLGLDPDQVMRTARRLIRNGVLVRTSSKGDSERRKLSLPNRS